jgi:ammonia channel protein AmtB
MLTSTSAIVFNFILSFSGGLMAGYLVSKGDPFWTYSGGLAGIICASAGNDLYHPLQAFVVGAVGTVVVYKLHNWVTKRFRIDDPVGAVAVHGYGGAFGTIVPGFLLWGYPDAMPIESSLPPWFANAEGWPIINPVGQILGAFIMFFVLGFIPGYVTARILKAIGMLRVPREVELAGLDTHFLGDAYPYFPAGETEFESIERQYAKQ